MKKIGNVAGKVGNAACGEGGLELSEATNAKLAAIGRGGGKYSK